MPMSISSSNKSTDLGERLKEKVYLKGAEETLFATLLPKARDAASPNPILGDPYAQRLIDSCDVDLERSTFRAMDNERGIRWVAHRARRYDDWCRDFLARHKDEPVTVLHMACGLDCRAFRTRPGANVRWIDLDRQHVIHLRKRLITQPPPDVEYSMRTLDVSNPGWMRDLVADRRTLVMAEGLFMYLQPAEVETAIHDLVDYFKQGELIFDVISTLYVTLSPHVEVLQASGARWHWGVDDIKEVEKFHPNLKLVDKVYPKELIGSKRFGQDIIPLFGEGTLGALKMAAASLSSSNDTFGLIAKFEFNAPKDEGSPKQSTPDEKAS